MAIDAETLQQFFIRIGVDGSEVETGSRAIIESIRAVHQTLIELVNNADKMQQSLNKSGQAVKETNSALSESNKEVAESAEEVVDAHGNVVDASNKVVDANQNINDSNKTVVETNDKIVDSNDRVTRSTQRSGNYFRAHISSISNAIGSLRNQLLGFAGITLSLAGAGEFVDHMTNKIQGVNNASQQLGVSAQSIDGWNRAFEAAGDGPSAGQSLLSSIRSGIDGLANGQGYTSQLTAIQQITAPGTVTGTSNPEEVLRAFVQALHRMGQSDNPFVRDRERALAQQGGLGVGGNVAALNGNLLRDQSYFASHSPYSGINSQEVHNIARVKAQLDQLIDSIGVQLYRHALPALNSFAHAISAQLSNPNSPLELAINNLDRLGPLFSELGSNLASVGKIIDDITNHRWRNLAQDAGHFVYRQASTVPRAAYDYYSWLGGILKHQALPAAYNAGTWLNNTLEQHGIIPYQNGAGNLPTRNNNPGDIRSAHGGFRVFDSAREGWEAMRSQLMRYFDGKTTGRHLDTISSIISTWAPGNENNTGAYISDVAKRLGVSANQHLNLADSSVMSQLMQAIAIHEGYKGDMSLASNVAGMGGAGLAASQYVTHNSGGNISHETHIGTVNLTNGHYSNITDLVDDAKSRASNTILSFNSSQGQT